MYKYRRVIISVIAATIVFNILKKYGKVEAQNLCVDERRERLTLGNIECIGSLHSIIVIGEIKDSHYIPVAK